MTLPLLRRAAAGHVVTVADEPASRRPTRPANILPGTVSPPNAMSGLPARAA